MFTQAPSEEGKRAESRARGSLLKVYRNLITFHAPERSCLPKSGANPLKTRLQNNRSHFSQFSPLSHFRLSYLKLRIAQIDAATVRSIRKKRPRWEDGLEPKSSSNRGSLSGHEGGNEAMGCSDAIWNLADGFRRLFNAKNDPY